VKAGKVFLLQDQDTFTGPGQERGGGASARSAPNHQGIVHFMSHASNEIEKSARGKSTNWL
jgi:hypothetical protein